MERAVATQSEPSSGAQRKALAHNVDWNLLRVFCVIAEKESITLAAEALQRTQPAVSAALKRLEDSLGNRLVTRSSSTFRLTETGAILYRECREVFNRINHLTDLLDDGADSLGGTLKITMASHIVSDLIDRSFGMMHRRHPNVILDVEITTSSVVVEKVKARAINFGICLAGRLDESIVSHHLFREHFAFYCGPHHRFFGRRDLTVDDLAGEKAVSFKAFANSELTQVVSSMHQRARLAMPFSGVSDNLEEIRRMIVSGMGIGSLPVHVMERDVLAGRLWPLPPYDAPTQIDVYLISSENARFTRGEQAFIEILKEITGQATLEDRTYGSKVELPDLT